MRDIVDRCCFVCRSPSGVCATKYSCDHHKEAQAQIDRSRPPHPDPVGEYVVGKMMREQKRKRNSGRRE